MDLFKLSAKKLAEGYRSKEFSALEVAKNILERISAVDERTGAYITLNTEGLLNSAKEIDKRFANGEDLPPLAGVPIALKDNICVSGLPMTAASKMLEGFIPPYDATVTRLVTDNGMMIIGKVNLDEFAMGASCADTPMRKTRNPHDLSRIAGGSSGGSGACLAAGEAALSIGSDTGGSVRTPAAYCGVTSIKPTYGAISRFGIIAFASSLDQAGPMARSIEDLAILYDALCVRDAHDAMSRTAPYGKISPSLDKQSAKGLRIGVVKEYFTDSAVSALSLKAAEDLKALGAEVIEVSLPSTRYSLPVYHILSCAEGASNLAKYDGLRFGYRAQGTKSWQELFSRSRDESFGSEVKKRVLLGTYFLTGDCIEDYYNKARRARNLICRDFDEAFKTCDLLLSPTTPNIAPVAGADEPPEASYERDICTVAVNLAGISAISLPCGFTDGMPAGLQLIANRWEEPKLFNAAYAYEQAFGYPGLTAAL